MTGVYRLKRKNRSTYFYYYYVGINKIFFRWDFPTFVYCYQLMTLTIVFSLFFIRAGNFDYVFHSCKIAFIILATSNGLSWSFKIYFSVLLTKQLRRRLLELINETFTYLSWTFIIYLTCSYFCPHLSRLIYDGSVVLSYSLLQIIRISNSTIYFVKRVRFQSPKESRSVQRPKYLKYNIDDEDNSANNLYNVINTIVWNILRNIERYLISN